MDITNRQTTTDILEEIIAPYEETGNGSGPFWSFASSSIIRDGDWVYASLAEKNSLVKPLNNMRWRLFRRSPEGAWSLVEAGPDFNEREPHPLVRPAEGKIILSANPAGEVHWVDKATDREYKTAQPVLLEWAADLPANPARQIELQWPKAYRFTDHSYRGISADSASERLILFHIEGYEGYRWLLLDSSGSRMAAGEFAFPERACYPAVALKENAVYMLAVRDIDEPNAEWKDFKFKLTNRRWDFVFDKLYFTWSPDIRQQALSEPVLVADVSGTSGTILQQDMLVDDNNDVHLLYKEQNIEHQGMRDRYFPHLDIRYTLNYAVIRQGCVISRQVLYETIDPAADNVRTASAVLHRSVSGELYAFYYAGGCNWLQRLIPFHSPVQVGLQHTLTEFLSANERTGTRRSGLLDLYGIDGVEPLIRYVRIAPSPCFGDQSARRPHLQEGPNDDK